MLFCSGEKGKPVVRRKVKVIFIFPTTLNVLVVNPVRYHSRQ